MHHYEAYNIKYHPKLIDSFPMMKDNTLDWDLSNSLPVGFIAFSGLKGFPPKVPSVIISSNASSEYIAIGELNCFCAIFGLPTVVNTFCPRTPFPCSIACTQYGLLPEVSFSSSFS